jgi:hypothetical protein
LITRGLILFDPSQKQIIRGNISHFMKHENWQIRLQADDFLNAYHVLVKNYGSETLALMGPSVVCLAFAVELYLKDLHHVVNGKARWGHNICKLFEALSEGTRQKVFSHKSISENPFMSRGDIFSTQYYSSTYTAYDRFIDQLKGISDGFEKWRYAHEVDGAQKYDSSFALTLITAISSTADNIRRHTKS